MLGSSFISDDDAMLQLGVLAWLIRKYGPPRKPKVPSPLNKPEQLDKLSWLDDSELGVDEWAQSQFKNIKNLCGMRNWPVQLAASADKLNKTGQVLSAKNWNMNNEAPYYVDGYGRPVIYFDPPECSKPGYFALSTISKLAEIKLMNFPLEVPVSPLRAKVMIFAAACYMRQGFEMATLLKAQPLELLETNITPFVAKRILHRNLAFSICTLLLSLKLTPEQIVATYGPIMSKRFRNKLRPACKYAETYETELMILRILANPKHEIFESHSYASTA
ncbi:hypothetical protein [Hellea balneolensis]|uniref:hypothetical protein n=1 Tax=Hellea balneolensis TaxID=287478 RepID=UPI0004134F8F|nr:hypothetical protein [Hellea balneolensis]